VPTRFSPENRELAKPLPERARPLSVPDFRSGEFSISGRNLSQLGSGILRDLNSPIAFNKKQIYTFAREEYSRSFRIFKNSSANLLFAKQKRNVNKHGN
jgi:hypothetical protein